jgi:hypothetical protein
MSEEIKSEAAEVEQAQAAPAAPSKSSGRKQHTKKVRSNRNGRFVAHGYIWLPGEVHELTTDERKQPRIKRAIESGALTEL